MNYKPSQQRTNKLSVVTTKEIFQHGPQEIPYNLIRSKRRKTCEIIVDANEISFRVPYSKPLKEIEEILQKKIRWIVDKQKEIVENEKKKKIPKPLYLENTTLPYLGTNYPIELNISLSRVTKKEKRLSKLNTDEGSDNKDSVRFKDDKFLFVLIYHDEDVDLNRGIYNPLQDRQERIKKLYDEWIYNQAEKILKEKVNILKEIVKVSPKKVMIKRLKDRWGSVTKNDTINLNVNMVKAPEEVIDYVIFHELCHFVVKGHSRRFWNYLEQYVPDYKEQVEWLILNGNNILT